MHHPREPTFCVPQQSLRPLHYQNLQHVPDHQLLDLLEPVEVVRGLLLQLDVVPRPLEVLRCGELHHSCDELAVMRLEVLGEARDEVLLEAGSVVGVFGLLVGLVPASGGVLESAIDLDHVNQFELGEAHDADVLDDHLEGFVLAKPVLLVKFEAVEDGLIGVVVDAVNDLALEDADALEVELVALGAHGVTFDDHEGAEDPVVKPCVGVDPARSPGNQLIGSHALGHCDALMHPFRKAHQVALVDVEVGLLDVLVLLVVGDDEAGVVHDLVGLAVGLGVALVVDVQRPALEEVLVKLLLQLVVVLQGFFNLWIGRPLFFWLDLALTHPAHQLYFRCFHY